MSLIILLLYFFPIPDRNERTVALHELKIATLEALNMHSVSASDNAPFTNVPSDIKPLITEQMNGLKSSSFGLRFEPGEDASPCIYYGRLFGVRSYAEIEVSILESKTISVSFGFIIHQQ